MFVLLLMGLFFVLAYIPTWRVAFLMRRRGSATIAAFAALISGPTRFMFFANISKFIFLYVTPSADMHSTKMRLLNGHQAIIPNGEMARLDIANVSRRPHIRRRANIGLPYDTPVAKVTRAAEFIRAILDDHEGMAEGKPAQVYFDNFKSDCLNIEDSLLCLK